MPSAEDQAKALVTQLKSLQPRSALLPQLAQLEALVSELKGSSSEQEAPQETNGRPKPHENPSLAIEGPPSKKAKRENRLLLDRKEIWTNILSFVGPGHFIFVSLVCRRFQTLYRFYFCRIIMKARPRPLVWPISANGDSDDDIKFINVKIYTRATDSVYRAAFSTIPCAKLWDSTAKRAGYDSLLEEGGGRLAPEKVCSVIAKYGNLEVLKWAHQNEQNDFPLDEHTCHNAAEYGHLEVLQWARSQNCRWNQHTCKLAAENGHLEVLKYAHEKGCPWNARTCEFAAMNGHLDVLKYAHEKGCEWDWRTCAFAALNGHLECLKYAHEKGCPWDQATCTDAAWNGHLDCLKYARGMDCPWNEERVREVAVRNERQEILDWLSEPQDGL